MAGTDPPANDLLGRLLVSADGVAIGLITDILIDTATRTRVATVELGSSEGVQLIPLLETDRRAGEVEVEFGVDIIRSAPVVTEQLHYRTLPEALESAREHFGVPVWTEAETSTPVPTPLPGPQAGPVSTAATPTTDPADNGPSPEAMPPLATLGPARRATPASGPATSEDDDPPWLYDEL